MANFLVCACMSFAICASYVFPFFGIHSFVPWPHLFTEYRLDPTMRLFDVMSALVVAIGTVVGGVIALLEPNLACGFSVGFFSSLLASLVVAALNGFDVNPYSYMALLVMCNGTSAFITYRSKV